MCLRVLVEIFGNAIGIILGSIFLFVILSYLMGFLIGAFIMGVAVLVLTLTNPVNWIFLIVLILGGFLLLNR